MEINDLHQQIKEMGLIPRVIEKAIEIQQIPAPTFAEQERGAFVQDGFLKEGLVDVNTDEYGNVYGRLPGNASSPPIIISAHLDTVFPSYTDLSIRQEAGKIFGPGIGDNSFGVASLFGLIWFFNKLMHADSGKKQKEEFRGDIWFVANVGEEGLGDLYGMRALVKRFGKDVLVYLAIEGMALGYIYHRALGVRRYRITVRTKGGHSWADFGRPSAIHTIADLIASMTRLKIPVEPRSSMNIGVIGGGTSVNTIASEAHFELDLRSENADVLQMMNEDVDELVAKFSIGEVKILTEPIGNRPAGEISADHPFIQLSQKVLEEIGIHPNLTIGSTDVNIPLSLGIPALCVGVTSGGNAHTIEEYINTELILKGIIQLILLVEDLFKF